MNRAQDWNGFRAAASLFDVPAQNLIYADVDGNIGYQAPGTVPVRATGDGTVPVPGWTSQNGWSGTVPFDDLPSMLNPERGLHRHGEQPGERQRPDADPGLGSRLSRSIHRAAPRRTHRLGREAHRRRPHRDPARHLGRERERAPARDRGARARRRRRPRRRPARRMGRTGRRGQRPGGVLRRVLAPPPRRHVRHAPRADAPRGRRPVVRRRVGTPRRSRRALVDERGRRGRRPRRHDRPSARRGLGRGIRPHGRRPRRVALGSPAHPHAHQPELRRVGHRPHRVALQPRAVRARRRLVDRERHRLGRDHRLRRRLGAVDAHDRRPRRLRRVNAGSTSRARRATRSIRTTPTRPRSGSAARRGRGRSRSPPCARRPPTRCSWIPPADARGRAAHAEESVARLRPRGTCAWARRCRAAAGGRSSSAGRGSSRASAPSSRAGARSRTAP